MMGVEVRVARPVDAMLHQTHHSVTRTSQISGKLEQELVGIIIDLIGDRRKVALGAEHWDLRRHFQSNDLPNHGRKGLQPR
jgi:hypothetical protein